MTTSLKKLRSHYKPGLLIKNATPSVLEGFLKHLGIDLPDSCDNLQKQGSQRYQRAIEAALLALDPQKLERIRNVGIVASNDPKLPMHLLFAFMEYHRVFLPEGLSADQHADVVVWFATTNSALFRNFITTNAYRLVGTRQRSDRTDIIPEGYDIKSQLDQAEEKLSAIVKEVMQKTGNRLPDSVQPIVERRDEEMVIAMVAGEPALSEEITEEGEETYRNITKAMPVTIVFRPKKQTILFFAKDSGIQNALAQAVARDLYGNEALPAKQDHHQAFNLSQMWQDLIHEGRLNIVLPAAPTEEGVTYLGCCVNALETVQLQDWLVAKYEYFRGYGREDRGQQMARNLLWKYTKFPQGPDIPLSERKEHWTWVDLAKIGLLIYYRNADGNQTRRVFLHRDGSSNLTTDDLDEGILRAIRNGGYDGKRPPTQPMAIVESLFIRLQHQEKVGLTARDAQGLRLDAIQALNNQSFLTFQKDPEMQCGHCGALCGSSKKGTYSCPDCGDVSQVAPRVYTVTRLGFAKSVQRVFGITGDAAPLQGSNLLLFLGTLEDGQEALLWFGDQELAETEHSLMKHYKTDVILLHRLSLPPQVKRGYAQPLFEVMTWQSNALGMRGKLKKKTSLTLSEKQSISGKSRTIDFSSYEQEARQEFQKIRKANSKKTKTLIAREIADIFAQRQYWPTGKNLDAHNLSNRIHTHLMRKGLSGLK